MMKSRTLILTLAAAMVCLFAASALADDTPVVTQTVNGGVVSVTIEYTGTLSALGYQATLPEGMSVVAVDPANAPSIQAGDSGEIDFAWITPPASPVTFSYTVSGKGDIPADVKYRRTGGEIVVQVD